MIGLIETLLLTFSFICIIMNKLINYNPPPIFNVYQQPNGFYWLKVMFMFFVLNFRQLIQKIKQIVRNKAELQKYYDELEKAHKLSNHDQPIDAVYFNAANAHGHHLVVGTARRKNGLIDGFFYLKVNEEIGLLQSPKLPDTSLQQTQEDSYEADGLKVICLEPMKKWKITYNGKMKKAQNYYQVELDVVFTSNLPYFNFDTDADPWTMSKCIALEKWSGDYFKLLKLHHQTHYEQHGNLNGNVVINGQTYQITMDSMRDHSFGNHREWKNLHKYNIHILTTENGDRFSIINVCFPLTLSGFQMGYVYVASDKKVYPITYNDFQLYQHGEAGTPPIDYAFTIHAGGKIFTIKVDVVESPYFYISKDWESKVIERLCTFKVNGLKGWGASEWEQRNISGRNILNQKNDEVKKTLPVRRLVGQKSTELFEKMLKS